MTHSALTAEASSRRPPRAHRHAFLTTGAQAAVDAGAPEAIVAAMTAHKRIADVAYYGCWALHNITCDTFGQRAAISARAFVAIIEAMVTHTCSADITQYGCRALLNIACLPAGRQSAVRAGALAAIVEAMVAQKDDVNVAHYGCWALGMAAQDHDVNAGRWLPSCIAGFSVDRLAVADAAVAIVSAMTAPALSLKLHTMVAGRSAVLQRTPPLVSRQ